jgi:CheY-like chemotaxis protein
MPTSSKEPALALSLDQTAQSPEHQATVLIVEDEPITREVLVRSMEMAGLRTRSCATGEEALEILQAEGAGIDWLLTDISLPGMVSGWVVGAEFHLSYPFRPVIYASAREPAKRYTAGGVYVSKPCSPAKIIELIHQLTLQNTPRDNRTTADRLSELLAA